MRFRVCGEYYVKYPVGTSGILVSAKYSCKRGWTNEKKADYKYYIVVPDDLQE